MSLDALAERAAALVEDGTTVGLGSGRAASAFVRALAARMREGLAVRAVPASRETARLAASLGIPLVELTADTLDLDVDGADEVDPRLDLVKGYGGALVRERIVAAASRRRVILVEPDKLVPVLGTRGRLPVEVVPFGVPFVVPRLERLGLRPVVRRRSAGEPFETDNGNAVLDCGTGPIADAAALHRAVRDLPGVIDTGLFLEVADLVLVADGGGVQELRRVKDRPGEAAS